MIDKKREIFIKIENIKEIVETLDQIKETEEKLHSLFKECEGLTIQENSIFENWNSYIEDTNNKLDHLTL